MKSNFLNQVYLENKRLINTIIQKENYQKYFKYYEPKVAGDLMILLNNSNAKQPFLDHKNKSKLISHLINKKKQFKDQRFCSKWGGGTEIISGFRLEYISYKISKLMLKVADKLIKF